MVHSETLILETELTSVVKTNKHQTYLVILFDSQAAYLLVTPHTQVHRHVSSQFKFLECIL